MSMEVSIATESTPAGVMQDAKTIKEPAPNKATEGPSLARVGAQHHPLSKTPQLTSAFPLRMKQNKLSSEPREEIESLVKKLKPMLWRVLTTQDSVTLFLAELTTAL